MRHHKAVKAAKQSSPRGKRKLSQAGGQDVARLTPMAAALAVLAMVGSLAAPHAYAQVRPFGSGWMAAKGAVQGHIANTGTLPNGMLAGVNSAARQQQQSRQQLNRSVANLGAAAAAIAAQQAIQAAARANAPVEPPVPDGYTSGGLWDKDAQGNLLTWTGANRPDVSNANGKHTVNIKQTADKAILNWDTFHVGKNTTLNFDQSGGSLNRDPSTSSDWAVLNKVVGAGTAPSQIQGAITAQGTVMIVNQNGIVFSGGSQINVRNLVAAAADMDTDQFSKNGLYSVQSGGRYLPSFTNASGKLIVDAGAQIATREPSSVTQGGGYVLLMGKEVANAGAITTRKGQAELAAGDSFVIRKGVGTEANQSSTTRGNEIAPQFNLDSTAGKVSNTGLLLAREGDVTLAGRDVRQSGVAVATTTVNARGTIHLLNSAGDTQGRVTLGGGATTAVLIEDDGVTTALDSQRAAVMAASAAQDLVRPGTAVGQFDNLSTRTDRQDQSRVEIVSGGDVQFAGNSLSLATGGQIAVSAAHRSFVADGAILDVSGAVGVNVAMSSNNVLVNVQGNELRDSPANRDSGKLANNDMWVDRRNLVFVEGDYDAKTNPSGTPDRWYTAGGLLEVGGYLSNQGHSIGEWAAQGGTIQLNGQEVVTQQGALINLSGGTYDVATGYVAQTWLIGSDGRRYKADNAPTDMTFERIYKGYEAEHPRWGKSEFFINPLIGPRQRLENGYTVGRDAGRLIVDAPTSVLEGDILATVYQGPQQSRGRDDIADSYLQSQTAAARAGGLLIGQYGGNGLNGAHATDLVVGEFGAITGGMAADGALAEDRLTTTWLDAAYLTALGLGELDLASSLSVTVDAPLALADGGALTVTSPLIDIDADVTAHGGSIALGNLIRIPPTSLLPEQWSLLPAPAGTAAQVNIGANSELDLRGIWSNTLIDPDSQAGLPYQHGGSLTVSTTGGIALEAGSVVDVSSGGAVLPNGKLQGGKGGNVSLITNNYAHLPDAVWIAADRNAPLVFDGTVRAYGFNGGGTLTLSAPQTVVIGAHAPSGAGAEAGTGTEATTGPGPALNLDTSLFQSGFTAYDITGSDGMQIADGATLAPMVPVYRFNDVTRAMRGSTIAQAADLWTPPLFTEDPQRGKLTQRIGADVTLVSTRGDFLLPQNAAIAVDPGLAVNLYINGQTTVDGDISAPGGSILIAAAEEQTKQLRILNGNGAFSLTRSIWIGEDAVLNVAGLGQSATDVRGRSYGMVSDGGSIALGGANGVASDAFVIVRPGAVLDASGAAATIDIVNGNTATPTLVASDGGSIALNSNNGIYIDGTIRAAAGGAGASGGTLSMNLVSRLYFPMALNPQKPDGSIGVVPEELRHLRNITITQQREASGLGSGAQAGQADAGLLTGSAAISADQVAQGGFGSLALKTSDLFVFKDDLSLTLPRSLALAGGIFSVADATPDIAVALAAPYVKIDGHVEQTAGDGQYSPGLHDGGRGSTQLNASSFSVNADLLDMTGGLRFGVFSHEGSGYLRWVSTNDATPDPSTNDSTATSGGDIVNAAGFGQVNLTSSGDMRFGNGVVSTDTSKARVGWLKTSGDLTLTAAQLYPLSGASVEFFAGLNASNGHGGVNVIDTFDPARPQTLTIRRSGDDLPPQPASAFGNMSFIASTIDQGGVVRAPLGRITFNNSPTESVQAPVDKTVIFRSGSVTSASADGLLMPFGGTTDGVSYQGADGTLVDLGSAQVGTSWGGFPIVAGVSISATSVVGEAGAVLDLSGGGNLAGAGFVTGRGGSVDTLKTPLVNSNPANTYSAAGNQVYAIMPGYASSYAPAIAANGGGDPAIGRQVTIPGGVPGLPAGTYTLLPSSYALLSGAFRVEIGSSGTSTMASIALPSGSYLASGTMGVANTGIHDALPTQLILSSGKQVRSTSQYNEMSYTDFARSQAAIFGNVRPRLPEDGKILQFSIGASTGAPSLSFAGTANFTPADDGINGSLLITSSALNGIIDITAPGAAPVIGHTSLSSSDINAFHPATLFIGGGYSYLPPENSAGGGVDLLPITEGTDSAVSILDGADLHAGQVFLVGKAINVAGGATIDTRGQSKTGLDSSFGYVFRGSNFLTVANGWLNFLPATGSGTSMDIASGASLLTEGSIVIGAPGAFTMGDVNFGARYLTVTQDTINAGDAAALAAAQTVNVLPAGWTLNQAALDRLLRPSLSAGVPALERLTLTVSGSVNLFGNVTLDARSQSAGGVEFVLNTPAIYGLGAATDTATIIADHLVWNGIRTGSMNTVSGVANYGTEAPAVIKPNGAGTGTGNLVVQAQDILFGYDEDSRPTDGFTLDRIAVGFANVALNAGGRITANSDGTLSVGQSKDSSGKLVGGNLTLSSPLLTAEAGSTIDYETGGAMRVVAPAGVAPTDTSAVADLGGTLSFSGDSVFVDTALALPSGKLTLNGFNDVAIGSNARIDLAGRTVAYFDVNKYGWGGDLVLTSDHGGITQDAGALIDVSATYNQAGSIAAIADDGHIALNGTLRGSAVSDSQSGSIGLRAQSLGDFAALNAMLNDSGFFRSRAFVLRQGDLTVGDGVRAQSVSISVDDGSLTVNGKIDASGDAPGSIRFAAKGDLTLGAAAVLDTHGNALQTDSNKAPIEASNTAHIDLTTAQGQVVLTPGATIDMRTPDGVLRGKLEINAPRLGSGSSNATGTDAPANATGNDIAISAAGPLDIRGAASIAVNGFTTYTNAPVDPDHANGQIIDQAWLDLIHQDSTVFTDSALGNGDLQNRLAGLKAYVSAFHLRPGVTIASATPDGDLTVKGDLDFSNYRYGPGADTVNHSGIGEVGVINFRAGGTLTVKGSINDGFAPPPVSPDALTTLLSGAVTADYAVTTAGAVLAGGWFIGIFDDSAPAVTLGFALPLGPDFLILFDPSLNHPLPIDIPLAQDFTIGGFGDGPLGGEIRAADGHVLYSATDIVPPGTLIPAGSVLGRGVSTAIGAAQGIFTTLTQWPANTDLYLAGANMITPQITLPAGAVLPANFSLTDVSVTGPGDRKVWATSAMQTPGAQSWSMRLVGGADLGGADSRALRPAANLAASAGNVVLSDPFNVNLSGLGGPSVGVSVVRTGTGNLEILAGGSYRQDSPYGVYTAGTAIAETGAAANDAYNVARARFADGTVLGAANAADPANYEATLNAQRMYYTEHGGDFLLMAQGDIGGTLKTGDSTEVGNWLWNQGGSGQATAWGINFGSYAANFGVNQSNGQVEPMLSLQAFSGMGTLGGGNVTLRAGGDIGNADRGIVATIGGSGRVMDGKLVQTGGGTLTVEAGRNVGTGGNQFVDLRGDIQVAAGNFGSLLSKSFGYNGVSDPRPHDPLQNFGMTVADGGSFVPGDGAISVRARGDLAMGAISDPGRVGSGQLADGGADGTRVVSLFTLWTGRTVVDLSAAGGNAVPLAEDQGSSSSSILPSIIHVAAASGSIFLTPALDGLSLQMPSPAGELELLVRDSIIGRDGLRAVGPLSTSIASIPTPLNPAWMFSSQNGLNYTITDSNVWTPAGSLPNQIDFQASGTLFAFGANTISDASAASDGAKSHIYAINGDVTGLHYGEVYVDGQFIGNGNFYTNYYRAAKPVDIMAGGDIVNLGGMILHADPADISTIAAAGHIIYVGRNVAGTSGGDLMAGLQIAGPGTLEITAGKNIYQGSSASIESIGAKVSGDTRPGADIVLQAGVGIGEGVPGVGQVDWTGFANRYLDPANLAGAGPLADQPGKVAKTYDEELHTWLEQRFGFAGTTQDALAYFNALPVAQQRVFLRQVYYAELTAGGREYNDVGGPRFESYLRGRNAIAALFPREDAYQGDIRLFSAKETVGGKVASGSVHTDFGGDIQLLAPGGLLTVGTDGLAPGADAGLITQGAGNILIYSKGSVLLGLSRIMTTFGGNILAWSATGDINAGRGAKTTVLFTPPKLTYDEIGDVALAPQVPSSGAGIATLAPIPEVPPGNLDLIAPLGTIDAGEAGIRFSGNANFSALHVVNAENIKGDGEVTGIPVMAAVNVSALTSASAASSSAATAAQDTVQRSRAEARKNQPSIFSVQILGFGGESISGGGASPQPAGYKPDGVVQVLGAGELTEAQRGALTLAERGKLN